MVQNEFLGFLSKKGKIRVVIGNGFDLFCGLHTRYSDYYCKNWVKYKNIQIGIDEFFKNWDVSIVENLIDSYNIWDIFFAFNCEKDPRKCRKNWCDIEKLILSSLLSDKDIKTNDDNQRIWRLSKIHWPELQQCLRGTKEPSDGNYKLFYEALDYRMKVLNIKPLNMYEFLLDELNKFEKDFGLFVYRQINDDVYRHMGFEEVISNHVYRRKTTLLLEELSPSYSETIVDSFNYSFLDEGIVLNHINGSWDCPIFGVDSIFNPEDNRFIFTKTSRRIESKMVNKNYDKEVPFESVVVIGHSLDQADYSYYFPIFDKLGLLDSNASGVVVFAYYRYGKKTLRTIKSELREAVSRMLFKYAIDHGVANPNRVLDSVSTQKKLFFYEVNQSIFDSFNNMYDEFEDKWQKLLKEMDEDIKKLGW